MRLLALALVALLAACGGGATPTTAPRPSATSGPSSSGAARLDFSFLLANPNGLIALDANGQIVRHITDLPQDSAPGTPAVFPERPTIVFAMTLPPKGANGFGSDLYTVDLDGTGLRVLLEHDAENVFYDTPIVAPSGTALYVHRRAAVMQGGAYVGNDDAILRVDLGTKKMTRIVADALDPTLSADGKTIIYVKIDNGQPVGLWRVNADGTGAKPFLTTNDTWYYLQSPQFSPDGKYVVFSAAGHNAKSRAPARGSAHLGIPSEIYLAPADGSSVRSIGQTGDDIVPAWSPDSSQIAYVATGGLQLLNVKDGSVKSIAKSENFFYGWLVWVKR